MEVKNPSFEIAGAGPGQAQDWGEAQTGGADDVAIFDGGSLGPLPYEGFESEWSDNHLAAWTFTPAMLTAGMFEYGTEAQETFETSWVEPATPTSPPVWNHHAKWAFEDSDLESALFDVGLGAPQAYEDFEEFWADNESTRWMWPGGALYSHNDESGARGAFGVAAGETLLVSVDGGAPISIAFAAVLTTASDIAAAIDALLVGGRAWSTSDGYVGLASDTLLGTIEVTGGTANDSLEFPTTIPVTVDTGVFDVVVPEPVEDFEEEWMSNQTWTTGFVDIPFGGTGTSVFAKFDGDTLAYEGFEGTWTETFA